MKNLLQRLRPQALAVIDNYAKQYPNTVEAIKSDLSSNYAIVDMRYNSAMTLNDLLVDRGPVDYMKLSDHFEMPEL
jgi:hypothetical protein